MMRAVMPEPMRGFIVQRIFVLVIALLSVQVNAWEGTDLYVDYIDVKSSKGVSIYFTIPTNVDNPKGCQQAGTVSWDGSNVSGQNFLSTFLAAKMSGAPVQIIVDAEACIWGSTGWPNLLTVRLK